MRKISRESVYQFNNVVREYITEEELNNFFKVTRTINKLIADKMIYDKSTVSVK